MGAFWTDAESIFETAQQSSLAGSPDCDLAILIGPEGGIHMLEASGWALSTLLAHHGAQTAYRVTREYGGVRVEGRSGGQTCVLRSEAPADTARRLLSGPFAYDPAGVAALPRRAWLSAGPRFPAVESSQVETWTTSA